MLLKKTIHQRFSKVVSTHLWNTPPKPLPTCYKGIPFIVGEQGIAWGVRYRGVLYLSWSFTFSAVQHPPKGPKTDHHYIPPSSTSNITSTSPF